MYAVLWGFLFAECALLLGFLLPGDTILFGAGLLAASPSSEVNIYVLVTGAFLAAVIGNEVGYVTGRRFGREWVERPREGPGREQLRRAERFYERYGWLSVVVARWIPWVRTFIPIIAGTAAMDRRAFTSANVVGALPWAVGPARPRLLRLPGADPARPRLRRRRHRHRGDRRHRRRRCRSRAAGAAHGDRAPGTGSGSSADAPGGQDAPPA